MSLELRELARLSEMSVYEKSLISKGFVHIAGIDEAGRGPLAGPVVAAACILPNSVTFEHLNDSKQLSATRREKLYGQITNHPLVRFGIGMSDSVEIDKMNILQATLLAMQRAVAALPIKPDYLLVDGNQLPLFDIPAEALIGGDCRSISIAASSIIAKVTRDRMMGEFDTRWPEYGFKQHKGYPTKAHVEAIRTHGVCPIHRITFNIPEVSQKLAVRRD